MGGFFSKFFTSDPMEYTQLPQNNPKKSNNSKNVKLNFVKIEIFNQVAIKNGSINENNLNQKIIKCLQVSDFLSRPKNYKVDPQTGGGFFNFMKAKKPLFIFCCENTYEALITLHFSWIKFIDPKFRILILGSHNNSIIENWNNFKFNPEEIKKLAYNSQNFSLNKINLTFINYTENTNSNNIIKNYVKNQKINLNDYDGVKIVFVRDFQDKKECELLDNSGKSVFPGAWVNSDFVKSRIFANNNPLVDGLFLPDSSILKNENNSEILKKLEGYLRFLMMHYSGNLRKSKNFKNVKLPEIYFFNYENMRRILITKIKKIKENRLIQINKK